MNISGERLKIIGKLIGIHREDRRNNSQNSWTQAKFCQCICSPNTLKNIETGKRARLTGVYEDLLKKLDLQLGEFPLIDEELKILIDDLYEAIDYYHYENIDSLTIKGIRLLDKAKGYVYYADLLNIFWDIRRNYIEHKLISEHSAKIYTAMLGLFTKKLDDIMRLLVFGRIKTLCVNNYQKYVEEVETLKILESTYLCMGINVLHYYYITKQRVRMLAEINRLEQELRNRDNVNRLVDVYSLALVMFSDFDRSMLPQYLNKAQELLKHNDISMIKITEMNANIAAQYYNLGNYEMALKYFSLAVEREHPNILSNCLLIADCQNRLQLPIHIPHFDKKELSNYPGVLRSLYQYFNLIEDEVPAKLKQKIILQRILPLLNDPLLIDIFRFELNKIVSQTNAYRSLYVFEKTIKVNMR